MEEEEDMPLASKVIDDFNIIYTNERMIENAERWYISKYTFYIIKAQKMHIMLIISSFQNNFLKT